mmetsp:Transcript_25187/g.42494  ORF Transcript_25187/g.42494 Transcript_25187/m.42494 type:complete len:544 (+) Transcript_25187:81-1712(+)
MSTLMSPEMSVGRSSTRRHAPPGGESSFSVAWGNDAPDPVKVRGGKLVSVPTPKKSVESSEDSASVDEGVQRLEITAADVESVVEEEEPEQSVGLVVVSGEASQHATACTTKALAKAGLSRVVVVEVSLAGMLVGAAKKLLDTPSVSGVLALLVAPPQQQAQATSQEAALFQLGNTSTKPVIPAVVCKATMLESKGLLPNLSQEWAGSLAGLLQQVEEDFSLLETIEPVKVVPLVPDPEESDATALLDIYRECLKSHGARGIFGLARKFKIMDDDNSKAISFPEFCKAIDEASLTWNGAQKQLLFDHFDRDQSGSVDFDEFLGTVRGVLNERRKEFVLMAYELLDADKSGTIDVSDISAKYDPSKHPDVICGKRSGNEVLREFLDTFDGADKDGQVTFTEFCAYYSNVSASIDDDDYFELMMRNAWHISGGEGWCANSSNRRVLATHADGKQTVEEIKNDLGISEDDEEAIWSNLMAQGLEDVTVVEFNSGKKLVAASTTNGTCDVSVSTKASTETVSSAPSSPTRSGRRGNNASGASSIVLG